MSDAMRSVDDYGTHHIKRDVRCIGATVAFCDICARETKSAVWAKVLPAWVEEIQFASTFKGFKTCESCVTLYFSPTHWQTVAEERFANDVRRLVLKPADESPELTDEARDRLRKEFSQMERGG